MDIYTNELNHIIIKDQNQNICELYGGEHKLEDIKEYIEQKQSEGACCLMCQLGLPITDENANSSVVMYIPMYTNLLVISDDRKKSKIFRQYRIQYCPLCGKKLNNNLTTSSEI